MKMLYTLIIALYIVGFAYFTYFCILADPEESRTADFWTRRLPRFLTSHASRLVGTKNVQRFEDAMEYLLQLLYLVVVLGSWSIMFGLGYPWMTESAYVANYHKTMGYIVFAACMLSWRYASKKSPGIITAQTLGLYDHYPYDGFLFVQDRICPTAGIPKLARSKYDRFSKLHIPRFDHFCGWLHNPIGEENYRFFLLFLLVHVLMCLYGTVVVARLFMGEVLEKKLLEATFFNAITGEEFTGSWYIIGQYLFGRHFYMAGVLLLMGTMTVVLGGFLGYHIYLTSYGMTTNEAAKWGQVKRWHKHELKRYKDAIKKGLVVQPNTSKEPDMVVKDFDVACTGAIGSSHSDTPRPQQNEQSEQAIMDPGPMPRNIYNEGLIENWKDVLFPKSLQKENVEKWRRSRREQEKLSSVDGTSGNDAAGKPKAI